MVVTHQCEPLQTKVILNSVPPLLGVYGAPEVNAVPTPSTSPINLKVVPVVI